MTTPPQQMLADAQQTYRMQRQVARLEAQQIPLGTTSWPGPEQDLLTSNTFNQEFDAPTTSTTLPAGWGWFHQGGCTLNISDHRYSNLEIESPISNVIASPNVYGVYTAVNNAASWEYSMRTAVVAGIPLTLPASSFDHNNFLFAGMTVLDNSGHIMAVWQGMSDGVVAVQVAHHASNTSVGVNVNYTANFMGFAYTSIRYDYNGGSPSDSVLSFLVTDMYGNQILLHQDKVSGTNMLTPYFVGFGVQNVMDNGDSQVLRGYCDWIRQSNTQGDFPL